MTFGVQWVVKAAVDVDIGANLSAEGGGDDEGVDDQAVKVIYIVDTFRLQVWATIHLFLYTWLIFHNCFLPQLNFRG